MKRLSLILAGLVVVALAALGDWTIGVVGNVVQVEGGAIRSLRYTDVGTLIGLWTFDAATGDDTSGNGNNGTKAGLAEYVGGALNVTGSTGRVTVPYSASLYTNNMTVCFWIDSDLSDYTGNSYAVGMYDTAAAKRQWGSYIPAIGDNWSVIVSSDGLTVAATSSAQGVQTGWHHVAWVVDNAAKTWSLYYDGAFVSTLTMTYSYVNKGSHFTMGGLDGSNAIDGRIDEVAIYSGTLSVAQIGAVKAIGAAKR